MRDKFSTKHLGLAIEIPSPVLPTARSYRPPSWPPPRDWICIEDKDGKAVSRWGDSIWNLSPWSNKRILINFGDGAKLSNSSVYIDRENADLFRLIMTWRIWGVRGFRSAATVRGKYALLKTVFSICSQNGILASNLSRHPKVIETLAKAIPPGSYRAMIVELNTLLSYSVNIGFVVLDAAGIGRLKASEPTHQTNQTEYIPPRIWQYQVIRLKEFLDDYLLHQKQIESCFAACITAHLKHNYEVHCKKRGSSKSISFIPKLSDKTTGDVYGSFSETAERFGIKNIIGKWAGNIDERVGIEAMSKYLSMATYVGIAYTLNFTLARINEGRNLRFNCLVWHDDKYDRIPLIQGPTTKTMEDASALWVTSPSVESAIKVMQSVAKMRSTFIPSNKQEKAIYLLNHAREPWRAGVKTDYLYRPTCRNYSNIVMNYPLLFEEDKILITEEDFKIAIAVTPTIDKDKYQIGKPWQFAWHQLRRTGSVNMFASEAISDASIQLQMKHLSRLTTLSYGRGHTTLNLNKDTRTLIVNAFYEALGKELSEVNSNRFISAYGVIHKGNILSVANSANTIHLLSEEDTKYFEKAARKNQISFRKTAIGACMKNGRCDGDGFSAVGDCAGGGGKAPCAHALFDKNRAQANKTRLEMVTRQIESTPPDSQRYHYLTQERRGLENYFACIK